MSKLIKLTDDIGSLLEERARKDGVSLAGEVKLLLDGKDDTAIGQRLDKMAQYLKERFDKLEKSIADTTVDRLERSSAPSVKKPNKEGGVEWAQMQYLIYTMDENSSEWLMSPSEVEALKEGEPADFTYFVEDDIIYRKDSMKSYPLMMVSPWVKQALEEGRVYE